MAEPVFCSDNHGIDNMTFSFFLETARKRLTQQQAA
jgi:hypothetical protein